MATSPPPTPSQARPSEPRRLARAILRRIGVPVTADLTNYGRKMEASVDPFGLALHIKILGDYSPRFTALYRTASRGIEIVAPGGIPAHVAPALIDVINNLEDLIGTKRRYLYNRPTNDWRVVDTGSGEAPRRLDPHDRYQIADPFESVMLDAVWANRTAKGGTRDWQKECRKWLDKQAQNPVAARYAPSRISAPLLGASRAR